MWKYHKHHHLFRSPSLFLRRKPTSLYPISLLHKPTSLYPLSLLHKPFSSLSPQTLHHFPNTINTCFIIPITKYFSTDSLSNYTSIKCWNCKSIAQTTPFLSCEICRSVQPLDRSVDYFQIFRIEKKYDIEDKNLEGKYKEWQKKLHPDLVHSKSEREREYAAEQSARVIDAYRTLSNPLSRAMYVLKLEGVDVDEEQTVSDPEMLAEILEIREAVEDATDSQALNQIQTQTQEKFNHWSGSFSNAFRSKQYEEAQISIQRMTYYKRVNEEIVKKL